MTPRTTTFTALLAATVLSAAGAGQLQASENDNLCAAIAAKVRTSGSNVCVVINDGVATLSGYVESAMEKAAAERLALESDEVDEVINLITTSN